MWKTYADAKSRKFQPYDDESYSKSLIRDVFVQFCNACTLSSPPILALFVMFKIRSNNWVKCISNEAVFEQETCNPYIRAYVQNLQSVVMIRICIVKYMLLHLAIDSGALIKFCSSNNENGTIEKIEQAPLLCTCNKFELPKFYFGVLWCIK